MVTITIKDVGTDRYTIEADCCVLGRRYDNVAEKVKVILPEFEINNGSMCTMIVAHGDTIIDNLGVGQSGDTVDITSNLSQYNRIKIGFAFIKNGKEEYIKNSEFKDFVFLPALKPYGFTPVEPERKLQLEQLISFGFAKVEMEERKLNFYNIDNDLVATADFTEYLKQEDIVDNLDTQDALKVLSANQGYVLNEKIKDLDNKKLNDFVVNDESSVDDNVAKLKVALEQDESNNLQYHLKVNDKDAGTINIPKDQFLKSVDYNEDTNILTFTWETTQGEKTTTIDMTDLVDIYTAGDGLELAGGKFSVKLDATTNGALTVSADGLKLDLTEIDDRLTDIEGNITNIEAKDVEQDLLLTAMEEANKDRDTKINSLETSRAEHEQELADYEVRIGESENAISDLQERADTTEENVNNLTAKVDTNTADIKDIKDNYATKDYVSQNGGKIDSISVNGQPQTIDEQKNVDLTVPTKLADLQDDETHRLVTDTEKGDRNDNTTQIASIQEKIPTQASKTNQLADKMFVNSTVQTATANFRGNWANWEAVPSVDSVYPENYVGSKTPTVNDYLVVQDASDYRVTPDSPQTAGLEGTWRFKFTGTWASDGKDGWLPEYQVNEKPFTAKQLAAIDSGITAELTLQITTNKNNITANSESIAAIKQKDIAQDGLISTNTQDITAIKAEQKTQNTNITNLQTAVSTKAENSDLQKVIVNETLISNSLGGFAAGANAVANGNNIQLGEGTNDEEKTLQIWEYKLLDSSGKIPAERIPDTFNPNAVLYIEQTLDDVQKAQARTNIGAGTSDFDGQYSSLSGTPNLGGLASKDTVEKTDLATDVQDSLDKADTAVQTESDPTVPSYVKTITQQNITDWNSTRPTYEVTSKTLDDIGGEGTIYTIEKKYIMPLTPVIKVTDEIIFSTQRATYWGTVTSVDTDSIKARVDFTGATIEYVDQQIIAGGADAVKYSPQSLSESQQAQARTNIGAGTSSFDGEYSSLTGTPTLGSLASKNSITSADITDDVLASKAYVDTKVSDLVNSAPETLDTLNELAEALGNDPNFATTIAGQIGDKASKTELNAVKATAEGAESAASAAQTTADGAVTKNTEQDTAITKAQSTADSKYEKPADGIPKTDLESAVQTSLDKADASASDADLQRVINNETLIKGANDSILLGDVGQDTISTNDSRRVVIGYNATGSSDTVAIGANAEAFGEGSIRIGSFSGSGGVIGADGNKSIAIGDRAGTSADGAIQLGSGTNSTENSLQIHEHNIYNSDTNTFFGGTARLNYGLHLGTTDGNAGLGQIIFHTEGSNGLFDVTLSAEANEKILRIGAPDGVVLNGKPWLDYVYPIGSVYISIKPTSPASLFGGTWSPIDGNLALWTTAWTSSTTAYAGSKISAGLPDISGAVGSSGNRVLGGNASKGSMGSSGAFSTTYHTHYGGCGNGNGYSEGYTINFNASSSNSLYGKSSTVQPPAYTVYAWHRTA